MRKIYILTRNDFTNSYFLSYGTTHSSTNSPTFEHLSYPQKPSSYIIFCLKIAFSIVLLTEQYSKKALAAFPVVALLFHYSHFFLSSRKQSQIFKIHLHKIQLPQQKYIPCPCRPNKVLLWFHHLIVLKSLLKQKKNN